VQSLRLPGALLILGLVGVLAWTIAYVIVIQPTFDPASTLVYWITTTAGYGLAGFACWRWIVGNWRANEDSSRIRGPSRWMAAASLLTAAGLASLTYLVYKEQHGLVQNFDYHYALRLCGDAAGTLGFLLAAVGFCIAPNARPPALVTTQAQRSEEEHPWRPTRSRSRVAT
jgi:peptidoglycan/LPS O-acetylase OafA/YrhL